jgi:hypothetical protein
MFAQQILLHELSLPFQVPLSLTDPDTRECPFIIFAGKQSECVLRSSFYGKLICLLVITSLHRPLYRSPSHLRVVKMCLDISFDLILRAKLAFQIVLETHEHLFHSDRSRPCP